MHRTNHHPHEERAERPVRRRDVRVGDADRREAAEALGRHLADGRLSMTEYEERLDRAFAVATRAELDEVIADLPRVTTAAQIQRRRGAARGIVMTWLGLCALFISIWALTGAGYFWPVWPIMGTGIAKLPTAFAISRPART